MKKIIKTIIVGQDSKKSTASTIGRGAIGGFLLGPVGLVGGALSGKNKNKTTFLIIYDDGSRETMDVKNGSLLYKTYISYLEI